MTRSRRGALGAPRRGSCRISPVPMLNCMTMSIAAELQQLRQELRVLVGSYQYAFAMGHGCTIGDHPEFAAVRRRAADLRARIAELSD